jgi:hypothetical protein
VILFFLDLIELVSVLGETLNGAANGSSGPKAFRNFMAMKEAKKFVIFHHLILPHLNRERE